MNMYSLAQKKAAFTLLAVFFIVLTCTGQEYNYINYDTKDGLPSSTIYNGVQSKDGFIWFATENGLSRFDGKHFTNFTTRDGLPDNDIVNVFVDSKNRVWALPFKPAIAYYEKGILHNSVNDSILHKLDINSFIFDIQEDKAGNLILRELNAIHIIYPNGKTKSIKQLNGRVLSVINSTSGLDENGDYKMLVSTNPDSLFYPVQNRLEPFTNDRGGSFNFLGPQFNISGAVDPLRTTDRIYINNKLVKELVTPRNILSLSPAGPYQIAYNTSNGVWVYNIKTGEGLHHFLPKEAIHSTFTDKENNTWFCTKLSGIYRLPSLQIKSKKFFSGSTELGVYCIAKAANSIIIGTDWEAIWKKDTADTFTRFTMAGNIVPSGKIVALIPGRNNQLIIGSNFIQRGTIIGNSINIKEKWVAAVSLKSCVATTKGLLAALSQGTILIDYSFVNTNNFVIDQRSTCAIEIEKDSGFYIGTLKGLYYKSYNNKAELLGVKFPVLSNRIKSLAIGSDNTLWIGTIGGGVVALKNQQIKYIITEKDGLTSNNCLSIFAGKEEVWIGTDKGLNRMQVNKKGVQVTNYTMYDGLCSNIIETIYVDSTVVYAGTQKGLSYFNPDKISFSSSCDLLFTGLYVSGKYMAYDSTDFSLPHKNNDIQFEFAGISFKSAGDITYRYRLLGLHTDWKTTTENSLSFPSLPSGSYTLQLKAINKYGVQSPLKEISFKIQKLLWEKTGFIVLAGLLTLLAVWQLFLWRIRIVKRKESEKTKLRQHMAELEQTALRAQMNPHFIFNCLNSIQHILAEKGAGEAGKYIATFSAIIRQTLDYSGRQLITLQEEISYLNNYLSLQQMRFSHGFNYFIHTDETIDLHTTFIPSMLLQPFLENSIQHGIAGKRNGQGIITVSITEQNNSLLCSLEDNGIGREKGMQQKTEDANGHHEPKGIPITMSRIAAYNQLFNCNITLRAEDIISKEDIVEGTRIQIFIPLDMV
jgi:ligand-binding sensor domain-containing protein